MTRTETCLLLGATGVGKTMLLKRLQNILRVPLNRLTSLKSARVMVLCSLSGAKLAWRAVVVGLK